MKWLNYHHLLYFWMVVREGGIQPAARRLRLTHPTISAQLKQLEESLGEPLFDRSRRSLQLTEAGRLAYQYADEIFSLGQEFMEAVQNGAASQRSLRLTVGATGSLPKVVVRQLLAPVFDIDQRVRLTCREDEHDRLLALLATHEIDVVFSDAPLSATSGIKAFNHVLGESGITFFASKTLKKQMTGAFPACMKGAPFLAPLPNTPLGRAVSRWMDEHDARPEIVAEIQDSALIKALGQDSIGLFCLPTVVEKEVRRQYSVQVLGRTRDIRERFYAISPERRLRNPAVVAICAAARTTLMDPDPA